MAPSFYGFATPAQEKALVHADLTSDLRVFMRIYHVDTVIVLPLGQNPQDVISHITSVLGRPSSSGGITVWYHVQEQLGGSRSAQG